MIASLTGWPGALLSAQYEMVFTPSEVFARSVSSPSRVPLGRLMAVSLTEALTALSISKGRNDCYC